jgi:site-specific DNA-adenine methylase
MKKYNRAPLPFNGQKARWLKTFMPIIEETNYEIYVDLFGGSGLLSHTVKTLKPNAKVVYNDFDNYMERLNNIDKTNALLSDLKDILHETLYQRRIKAEQKERVLGRIRLETGFIDWATLSNALLFTMHHVCSVEELSKQAFYNNLPMNPYNADGYLSGVTIVNADYRELFGQYRGCDAIFIYDPPYVSTDNTKYKNANYWKIKDYLGVLMTMKDIDYIYFTSEKSQIEELFLFMQDEFRSVTPFSGARKISVNTGIGSVIDYVESVYFKIRNEKQRNLFGF